MKKKFESGRSMVEMLGVLSVIGVLSISAVATYSYLMEKHRNNERLQETTMRAVVASSQMLSGKVPTLDGLFPDKKVLGHEISLSAAPSAHALGLLDENGNTMAFNEAAPNPGDEEFALEITDVPESVCEYFVGLANVNGIIQKVVDSSGKEITIGNCKSISGSGSSGQTSSSGGTTIYLVYKSNMAKASKQEIEQTLDGSVSVCNNHGEYTVVANSSGCRCDAGYSGDKCAKESEACSGHGSWFAGDLVSMCVCDEGYTGLYCNEMLALSPCQTLTMENGKEVRGFKPEGTACSQAGIKGRCDAIGHCVPSGQSCRGISECGNGRFCNYGGHEGDDQGGGTPDICENTNAESFEYEGVTYYHNTDADLRSWCRAADNQANCTWGFLSYYGAQSWCQSLGLSLVDGDYIKNNCAEFKKHLPQPEGDQQYWVSGQRVVHLGNNCSIQSMGRTDGYAGAAGVVCANNNSDDSTAGYYFCSEGVVQYMGPTQTFDGDSSPLATYNCSGECDHTAYPELFSSLEEAKTMLCVQIGGNTSLTPEEENFVFEAKRVHNMLEGLDFTQGIPGDDLLEKMRNYTADVILAYNNRNWQKVRELKSGYDETEVIRELRHVKEELKSGTSALGDWSGILRSLLGIKTAYAGGSIYGDLNDTLNGRDAWQRKRDCTAQGGNWVGVNGKATCCTVSDCEDLNNCCAFCKEALGMAWFGSTKGGKCCKKSDEKCKCGADKTKELVDGVHCCPKGWVWVE